jgi:hypothetical protein
LPETDAGIESLLHDIDEAVGRDDFPLETGFFCNQRTNERSEYEGFNRIGRVSNLAKRRVAKLVEGIERLANLAESRRQLRKQHRSCIGQRHAAGRPVEQSDADTRLKRKRPPTRSGRWRHTPIQAGKPSTSQTPSMETDMTEEPTSLARKRAGRFRPRHRHPALRRQPLRQYGWWCVDDMGYPAIQDRLQRRRERIGVELNILRTNVPHKQS